MTYAQDIITAVRGSNDIEQQKQTLEMVHASKEEIRHSLQKYGGWYVYAALGAALNEMNKIMQVATPEEQQVIVFSLVQVMASFGIQTHLPPEPMQ